MIYRQHKPFHSAGGIKAVGEGDVEVHVDLMPSESNTHIQPGSRIPLNINILNSNPIGKFDEIRIRLIEVLSWSSITGQISNAKQYKGFKDIATEITKLTTKKLSSWPEEIDGRQRRVIRLHNMSLDIPQSAKCDQNVGLIRIHHVLEVKLISSGYHVSNMKFRFPLVIGGKQYDGRRALPRHHAINYLNEKRTEQILADTVAAVVSGITHSAEYLLNFRPGTSAKHDSKSEQSVNNRPMLLRQGGQLIRSASINDSEKFMAAIEGPTPMRQGRLDGRAISI